MSEEKAEFCYGYFTAKQLREIADRLEPEPSQDELWEELLKECTTVNHFLAVDTAKKRYRITRL